MDNQKETYTPPKIADRFLGWFCRGELLEEIKGDLYEYYIMERGQKSKWRSDLVYWYHVLHFLRPFALKSKRQNSNTLIMYKSYFKFAWRNVIKHKGSTSMNVLSLGVGIACFIFIFVYLKGEWSYDRFHDDADRISRVAIDFVDSSGKRLPDATTPPALAPALKKDFPEVESTVRIFPNWGNKFLLGTSNDRKTFEEDLIRTDSTFFDVFDFPMIHGDVSSALDHKNQMVITRRTALKYYGREDVVGETMTLFGETNKDYIISGVLQDVPFNSHIKFDFLTRLSFSNIEENWGWYNYYTYMKLYSPSDIATLEPKLQPFFEGYVGEREVYNIIYSQPLTDIHLNSHLKWELEPNGNMTNVYIFSALGIFVLLISCLNYLNLTVAESFRKFKEVGVRKVFGAQKASLVGQFIVETFLVVFISLILGSILSEMLFRNLGELLGRNVSLLDSDNLNLFLGISALTLVIGILAGLYPAIHLSSFKAVHAVKGVFNQSGKSALGLRQSLLIIQFAISAFMIFGSIAVYQQMEHMNNVDKGFDQEQVLVIENVSRVENQQTLKNELLKLANVKNAGVSSGVIGGLNWTTSLGYPDAFLMNFIAVDPEFLETMEFELVAGRNFSRDRSTDAEGLIMVVNETALKEFGMTLEDIGKSMPMSSENDSTITNGTIIGVVKDFHFTDFKMEIKPFAFFYRERPLQYLSLKIDEHNLSNTLNSIEDVWSEVTGGMPIEYVFLDETFAELHAQEGRLSSILLYLTILALFIAFIGMLAIANMTNKDRRKDMAIHKVLGASVSNVLNMVTRKFLLLVLLANIIAFPIAYFILKKWLEGFAYRINLELPVYLLAIGLTVLVVWIVIGLQSYKSATSNPMNSLRQE